MRLRRSVHDPRRLPLSPTDLWDAIIEAGLLVTLIIAPLFFNPQTHHTFEPDKATLLRSVVLITLLAWLIKSIEARFRDPKPASSIHNPALSPVEGSQFTIHNSQFTPFLLLTTYVISTATSVLPRISFWGSYERGQGLYTAVTYILLFFLVHEVARIPAQRERLLDAVLLVSLPTSVYAVLQRLGLDPVNFQTAGAAVTARAISTLGNPIFLGAYLVMVIPLTILRTCKFRIAEEKSEIRNPKPAPSAKRIERSEIRGLYAGLLLLQLAALLFAQSRGPILGLAGGLVFAALIWASRQKARRVLAGVVLTIALAIAVTGLLPALAPGTAQRMLTAIPGRLGELVDPESRTARQRLLVWEGTVGLATSEPARTWVGYGPETLRDLIGPHLPAEIARQKPDEDFDRAHNAMLDLWATAGLLGVTAYLLVIGGVLYCGLRLLGLISGLTDRRLFVLLTLGGTLLGGLVSWLGVGRQWVGVGLPLGLLGGAGTFVVWRGLSADGQPGPLSSDQLLVVALLAAVVGHVVETLVGIAIVATQTLFWIYAGLIASLATGASETGREGDKETRRQGDLSTWGLVTGITLALFGFALLIAGQGRGALAWGVVVSVTFAFGIWRIIVGQPAGSDPEIRYLGITAGTVLSFWLLTWTPWPPADITHSTVAIFVYVIAGLLALAASLTGVDRLRAIASQISWGRGSLYAGLVAAGLVTIWFTNINPMRADVFYKQGLSLSAAGDFQNAAQVLEVSVSLNPREDRYYSGLGAAYAQMAQTAGEPATRDAWIAKAEVHLLQAQRLDPYRADHLRNLGVLYRMWAGLSPPEERPSRLRQALAYYEQAAARNPVSVRIWWEWGEVYAVLGEWEPAIQRYEESLQLNAGFVETWLLLAQARLRTADYAGARQAYSQALALDQARVVRERQVAAANSPDDPLPHQALALVYAALGQSQPARTEAATARRLMAEAPPDWDQFLEALQ